MPALNVTTQRNLAERLSCGESAGKDGRFTLIFIKITKTKVATEMMMLLLKCQLRAIVR